MSEIKPIRIGQITIGTYNEYNHELTLVCAFLDILGFDVTEGKGFPIKSVTLVRDMTDRIICTYDLEEDRLIVHGARKRD